MATVIAEMSMSLDGFVADPCDRVGPLFDWYGNGDVEVPTAFPERWTFRTSKASARYLTESMDKISALVAGRRLFDVGGWGENGQPWGVPVFVVTHSVPEGWPRDDAPLPFTFVTDGVDSAVQKAKATAGDGWVGVAGPNIAQQCLNAGLLDEIRINLVPVLFGEGIRYFGSLSNAMLALEGPSVIEGTGVTHLCYRVKKG
ncbi:MAG TPA: dihydrofolate reductase family protein [Streptosporangiaceae bacterium]|nr:dihydrofolate reductase family protein [Streptosporangiaceae bacterium]